MIVAFFLGHLFVLAHAGGLRGAASRRGRTSAARGAAPAGSGPCGPTALDGLRTLGVRTLARCAGSRRPALGARTLGCASRAAAQRRPAPAAAGAAFSRQPRFLTGAGRYRPRRRPACWFAILALSPGASALPLAAPAGAARDR